MARSKMFKRICLIGVMGLIAVAGKQGMAAESDAGVAEIAFWKQDIVITAEATTHRDVSSEKIKSLPVTSVAEILRAQFGGGDSNDRFYIRGCRAGVLLYTVEGVTMTEPHGSNGPIGVPDESKANSTDVDLWNLIESLYGDASGCFRELESDDISHFDVDENGSIDLIDLVQAVDETMLAQTE